jgi:hypothetical protein
MKWTRSENAHGWLATWTSGSGQFEIQKHIGPHAKHDYGHMTGQPYQVLIREECELPVKDGSEYAWRFGPRFHLLKQAKNYVETFLVTGVGGLTAAEESWNEIVKELCG